MGLRRFEATDMWCFGDLRTRNVLRKRDKLPFPDFSILQRRDTSLAWRVVCGNGLRSPSFEWATGIEIASSSFGPQQPVKHELFSLDSCHRPGGSRIDASRRNTLDAIRPAMARVSRGGSVATSSRGNRHVGAYGERLAAEERLVNARRGSTLSSPSDPRAGTNAHLDHRSSRLLSGGWDK